MKKTTTQGRYEIWKSTGGSFYFHYQSANGEIIAPSEGYTRKAEALAAIELLRFSFDAPVIDLTLKKAKARKGK